MKCNYCGGETQIVKGAKLYPYHPDIGEKLFYYCACQPAWVGCHKNTDKPMGTLANSELRNLRREVHRQMDKIWQNGKMTRSQCYARMSKMLNVSHFHIGQCSVEQCYSALKTLESW